MPHAHGDPLDAINLIANVTIFLGYLVVPFTVLVRMPLTMFVRVSGALFFLTCGITHLAMAFGQERHDLMVFNHVVQAAAVLCFVLSFARMVAVASTRLEERRKAASAAPDAGGAR